MRLAVTSAMADLMEFAVFDQEGRELGSICKWLVDGPGQVTMVVDRIPARAGIDPHCLLIDKKTDNNFVDVMMN